MMRRIIFVVVSLVFLAAFSVAGDRPDLVVLIAVDQMLPDYFIRYGPQFSGGLKQLQQEGLSFTNGNLNYAASLTGPGHACLATGSYPRTNGIIANEWIDPQTRQKKYCVFDESALPVNGEGGGMSPKTLGVDSIGDWLKAVSPKSKVLSIGGKDRAAILLGGHHPDQVYWYNNKTGHMTTSAYYTQVLPVWAARFNRSNWIDRKLPPAWLLLKPEKSYASDTPDEFPGETKWGKNTSFPHPFTDDKFSEIQDSPYWDELTLEFAQEAVRNEKLGQRGVPDLLCLALSATDYIGHSFGPNSREIHDQLLRLDLALGAFLKEVEKLVGKQRVLVVLTADHGVLPLPEYLTQQHQSSRRISTDDLKEKEQELNRNLQKELNAPQPVMDMAEVWDGFLNYEIAAKAGINALDLEKKVKAGLLHISGVEDVFFRRELDDPKTIDRPYLKLFQNSHFPKRSPDFTLRFCERCLVSSYETGTSHGSPYLYDTHVPLLFWGLKIRQGKVDRPVHTVDVAPTIARILGVACPKTVDGVPLPEVP